MKKLGIMLLAMLVLAGCSSKPAEATPSTDPTETPATTETAAWTETLVQDGIISIGVSPDYPPYETLDTSNQMVGFDIDFMNLILDTINKEGSDLKIEWVQMDFSTIISAIQMEQVDLGVSGFTYDKDRDVLFSTPYTESAAVVVVNPDSDIKSLDDLKGKVLAAQLGSTGEVAAKNVEGAEVNSINNVNIMMESLKNNAYDAVIIDKPVAENYVKNAGFVMLEEPIQDDDTYIIAKTGNTALMDKINAVIEQVKQTEAYQELLTKWELN
ncbi:transporter substrate-binding domain-containing protein [Anaerorhabdus sp.]|uniref:transporter substrate-binding domain-containing protein n=1 Tax=Anaerorhabdus sp. TaxID=1872524 RepID=UPI002FC7FCEF